MKMIKLSAVLLGLRIVNGLTKELKFGGDQQLLPFSAGKKSVSFTVEKSDSSKVYFKFPIDGT